MLKKSAGSVDPFDPAAPRPMPEIQLMVAKKCKKGGAIKVNKKTKSSVNNIFWKSFFTKFFFDIFAKTSSIVAKII